MFLDRFGFCQLDYWLSNNNNIYPFISSKNQNKAELEDNGETKQNKKLNRRPKQTNAKLCKMIVDEIPLHAHTYLYTYNVAFVAIVMYFNLVHSFQFSLLFWSVQIVICYLGSIFPSRYNYIIRTHMYVHIVHTT